MAHTEAMMKTKILAAMAVFAGVCAMAPTASAEPPKKDSNYEYKFEDDKMLGEGLGAMGAKITVVPQGRRERLLRPRVQFVQEMLKSVENM
jgi:hypothetical protein